MAKARSVQMLGIRADLSGRGAVVAVCVATAVCACSAREAGQDRGVIGGRSMKADGSGGGGTNAGGARDAARDGPHGVSDGAGGAQTCAPDAHACGTGTGCCPIRVRLFDPARKCLGPEYVVSCYPGDYSCDENAAIGCLIENLADGGQRFYWEASAYEAAKLPSGFVECPLPDASPSALWAVVDAAPDCK